MVNVYPSCEGRNAALSKGRGVRGVKRSGPDQSKPEPQPSPMGEGLLWQPFNYDPSCAIERRPFCSARGPAGLGNEIEEASEGYARVR